MEPVRLRRPAAQASPRRSLSVRTARTSPKRVPPDKQSGVPDRPGFEVALTGALEAASADGRPVSVAVVDIDLLGRINVSQGRGAGDAVISWAADRLGESLGPEVKVFRFGGDAWGVLFPAMEKEQAFLALETFRQGLHRPPLPMVEGKALELKVSLSAGLASHPEDGARPLDILNRASEALYRAKVSGRNKVCLAREERMVTKTSHYTQGQLLGLRRLAEREGYGDAALLREALNDLLRKYNA